MDLTVILKKYLGLFCSFIIILSLSGCYSHFTIKESIGEAVSKNREISKIKLQNEQEINFHSKENVLVSIDSDSLTYKDNKGEIHRTDIKDVSQWYEYRFNFFRTLVGTIFISVSILGMSIGTYLLFAPIRGN
ncbi:MAG: hypothetical protein ACYC4T_08900 [Melioribacteraceae bacterium]